MKKRMLSVTLAAAILFALLAGSVSAKDAADFTDVSETDWYYTYVSWCTENEYFLGTGDTTFSPESTMTRAMFVTVLSRLDGAVTDSSVSTFDDVEAGQWYTGAITWASENGIVNGYGGGSFGPDDPVTREQMCTILLRYIEYYEAEYGVTAEAAQDAATFTDLDDASSDEMISAIEACQQYGLVNGYDDGSFCPQNTSTRAQVAAVIYRLAALIDAAGDGSGTDSDAAVSSDQEYIETVLNLDNNEEQAWTYSSSADAWVMSIVSAVAYPEIEDEQGVSVCVPGAYVTGIDTDGDGTADVTADTYSDTAYGSLVIDYEAEVTSSNGQTYTASTAPVILNTGAAGYSSSTNTLAATTYASEGYINVACGNRGKQDTATDSDGNTYYTGDAPSCLVDQKNAARFVKYNILLGNLPGSVDYFVSTGGSGGGAHAVMFAATSNNSDYYDYEIECGAVGVYKLDDGTYSTTVTIDGVDYEISDGAWGCIAYSAITSLAEADMALAFEYYMDTTYDFGSDFQAQLAEYLSEAYMEYINEQNLTVNEADVGFDLNEDGDTDDTIALTIEYDLDAYPETNGYYGTYLDLYLAEFVSNLQWYLDNLDYADGWTWFDEDGNALSDEEVAAMTSEEKATAFIEGRYAEGSSTDSMGDITGGMDSGDLPGDLSDLNDASGLPDADDLISGLSDLLSAGVNSDVAENSTGDTMDVGTPDAGTTQAAGSSVDSENYETYEEMVAAYASDIAELEAGDEYGNNLVDLYNPLNYIGDEDTENPTWVRILMGASEGDISMFNSLNLQIAMLNAGIDANIEWQWDGGHVPSEIFSESFSLYVDQMYGEYVSGVESETPAAETQTTNGTADSATGTDLSSWVDYSDITSVSFSLADAVAYRTAGASKAMPGFDVIDYGQEDYVFGSDTQDARHWNSTLLEIFEEYADVLSPLFNAGKT